MRITIRDVDIHIDKALYETWERDPVGPVMRDLNRRGFLIQTRALILVGRKTGRLASSIRKNQGYDKRSAFIDIIAGQKGRRGTQYLGFHHYGTAPHVIKPRRQYARSRKRPRRAAMLRFTVGGQVIFRRQVMHPGTRGTYFLEFALPAGAG